MTQTSSRADSVVEAKSPPRGVVFLKEFLRKPAMMGTMVPLNRASAEALTEGIGLETAGAVAEFGPGTGAVTSSLLPRLKPGCDFFAIEMSPDLTAALRRRFPGVQVYTDDAANLAAIMRRHGVERLDAVVSSLPWTLFPGEMQDRLLGATAAALRPGGCFTLVTYRPRMMPRVAPLLTRLRRHFRRVERTRFIWNNIPPAFVYRCTR